MHFPVMGLMAQAGPFFRLLFLVWSGALKRSASQKTALHLRGLQNCATIRTGDDGRYCTTERRRQCAGVVHNRKKVFRFTNENINSTVRPLSL